MNILGVIAENKIREAIERGELDNLPCKGKPLKLDDLSHIPEELRAAYTLLKNAGVLPEELQLKKEIISLQKLIDFCHQENERDLLMKKLTRKILRFDLLMDNRKVNSTLGHYKRKIYRKFGGY
ncbi:MAG: hypothetical protein BWY80_00744 [Firmicutes bacterium ADurb.Bin456]|nr:MAG: hypothetical protein BWY80_00744 [Firmicutes bacterium ADurb.Bin456]